MLSSHVCSEVDLLSTPGAVTPPKSDDTITNVKPGPTRAPRDPYMMSIRAAKRSDLILEDVSESDLMRCSEIFLAAFANDEAGQYVRPPRLRNPSKSYAERVADHCAGTKARFFGKKGVAMVKAIEKETGKILGLAVWLEPELSKKSSEPDPEPASSEEKQTADPELDPEFMENMMKSFKEVRERLLPSPDNPHW